MTTQDLERWEADRRAAADAREWQEIGSRLPCVQQPVVFEEAAERDSTSAAARVQAKRICETACQFQELCLRQTLRLEQGQRGYQRAGIVAGLTGAQRARIAQQQGCGVCGAKLPEDSSRLYCLDHATRSALSLARRRIA